MNTILKACNIVKTYRTGSSSNMVLKSVRLEIRKGDFLSVMGPSGSGKSTLLYNISGMDRMDEGQVEFGGESLSTLSEKKLSRIRLNRMGFIFQQIHLLKNLSIRDNILLPAFQAAKRSRQEILERADQLLEETGIADVADNDITQASGGQLQRAAICRALINEPDIIFGDEPTGALNSGSARGVMDILGKINDKGTTVMLVTHDVKVAAGTKRVLFMKDGVIAGEFLNTGDDESIREQKLSSWLFEQGF